MSAPTLGDIETPADFDALEWKALPKGETSSPLTGVIGHDDKDGTITAMVAVSGVADEVGDVIVPGSLEQAVKRLKPKGVLDHNWSRKVSKLVWAAELMPGDPRLPRETPQGDPWPVNAGGLLVKAQYNLNKEMGRDAYEDAKFYGPEECFSIGYKVRPGGAKMRGGKRHLFNYDVYEWSQVLHGAHRLAHLTGVKSLADETEAMWYDDTRSGDIVEGTTLLSDGVETKAIRVVRNAEFWGMPYGTPIRSGMRPRGQNRAATPQEIAATTAPQDDAPAGPGGAPTPGQGGVKPGQDVAEPDALGAPGQAAPDAVATPAGPGAVAALAALRERYADFAARATGPDGVHDTNAMAMLSQFARAGADVRASGKGEFAAVIGPQGWTVLDTVNASMLPSIPGDIPPETVDRVLQELADLDIPWADLSARRKRWANAKVKKADQDAVREIFAGATPFGEPDPVQAGRADAQAAIADSNRAALIDALTAMSLPQDTDPYELADRLLTAPEQEVAERLDGLQADVSSLQAPDGAPSAPSDIPATPEEPFKPVGNVNAAYIAKLDDDKLKAEHDGAIERHQRARANRLPSNSVEFTDSRTAMQIYGDEIRKRTATRDSAHTAAVGEAHSQDQGTATAKPEVRPEPAADKVTVTRKGKKFTLVFSKLPGRTFGPYDFAEAVRDLTVSALLSPMDARNLVMDAGANGTAQTETDTGDSRERLIAKPAKGSSVVAAYRAGKMSVPDFQTAMLTSPESRPGLLAELGVDEVESLLEHSFLSGDNRYRDQVVARLAEIDPARAAGPQHAAADRDKAAAARPVDAVPVPDETVALAERVRDGVLGIEEGPDGELTLTEEAAARQDRVISLLGEGDGDDSIAGYSDEQLGSTRRDLVDELALQDELRRRDVIRKQEVAAARAARQTPGTERDASQTSGGDEGTVADTAPKLRPGLAGAAEDLGDALNESPRNDAVVTAAAERFAKLVRRAPADSKAFVAIQKFLGDRDNIHVAIARREITAGMLFTAAAALREERRTARNAAARERRKARRIERDRIRSMIGMVDVALRTRGLDPHDYGGAVESDPSGPATSTTAPPPTVAAPLDAPAPPDPVTPPAPVVKPATDLPRKAQDALERRARRSLAATLREMGATDAREQADRLLALGDDDADRELEALTGTLSRGAAGDSTPVASASTAAPPSRRAEFDAYTAEDFPSDIPVLVFPDWDREHTSPHSYEAVAVRRARNGYVTIREPKNTTVDVFPRQLERQGAQSPQYTGGGDGDQPGAGAGSADRSADRRPGGPRPVRGDLPVQGGTPDGGESLGTGGGGPAAGRTERGAGARDAGGPGAVRSDDGVSGGQRGAGPTQSQVTPGGDADLAPTPGVTAEDQPQPETAQVEAIPNTGARFMPVDVDDFAPAGKKAKLEANLAALRVLRELQTDRRSATADEQTVLARWAGWGGLPEVFDDNKPEYAAQREQLRGLLSESEWNEARRNTLNAHYTDPRVVQALWQAMGDLGFDGGRVLEPGSGSGTFIGYANNVTDMVGVELDSTTAAISAALYPDATIRNESFADTRIPAGSFDATIGNVPFGQFALQDRVHNPGRRESIHNHFILKSLALTKPGGLVTLLTSRYTLDAESPGARKKMAEMGDLIGAVRLPTGSHSKISGTDVIEDILIFRRREPGVDPLTPQDWVNSTKRDINGFDLAVNDYFTAHPEQVLGEITAEAGEYGSGSILVKGDKSMAELPNALQRLTSAANTGGVTASARLEGLAELTGPSEQRHDGHIAVTDDGFTQAIEGTAVPFEVPEKQAEELRALLGMRDTLRELLTAESVEVSDSPGLRALRTSLNDQYDAYVARYGPVNRYKLSRTGARSTPAQGGFRKDPMSAIVRALEVYDPESGTGAKTDIFRKRAVSPREIPTHADTPEDALALCMDTYGEVNLAAIAEMLSTDMADAQERLTGLVFEQPPLTVAEQEAAWTAQTESQGTLLDERISADQVDLSSVGESVRASGKLEPAAAYLSGNVRRKLAAARAAAEHDPRFQANVEALAAVIPQDLGIDEVDGRLGAAWIGVTDVRDFLVDLIYDGDNRYNSVKVATSGGGIWTVQGAEHGQRAVEQWGTDRLSAGELVQAMLEQRPISVRDTIDGKSYPNLEATIAAQAKAEEISERFSEWLWEDPDRTRRLLAAYNNQFNAIRLRSYDDIGRTFPGMADTFKPFDHQVAAVNRIVAEPCALLAHVVGAGKTAEMAMGAAELKRLGLARKPSIVVPNHMLEQFSREFLQIYPNAKVLAAGTDDLTGDKRREFVARAATSEWDCVILTQGAMELIPMSRESMSAYIDREMATMRAQLAKAKADAAGDSAKEQTVKRMEKALIKAEEALKAKLDKNKDAGVSFEQTGIDYVFVDEAHHYSNLRTPSNIQGAGATGSNKATDLHMKIEHLRANNASGRVATFATGTPIRNTVTQAYIMQRFLRPDLLEEAGIHAFDQWAATFGQTVDEMELKPEGSGFRQTTRFAKFRNVPELLRLFHMFADVKMADDLNLKTPDLATGAVQNVVVPASPELRAYIAELGKRADDVRSGAVKPEDDNMLKISTDGRKAALSMELVGGKHAPGKIEQAAENIVKIWNETKDRPVPKDINDPAGGDDPPPGGMQLVFLDMGTPGGAGMDAYAKLREQCAARGMDPSTIRFMHDAKNDAQKAELFAAARNGQVSVLVGSTEKMGVGTNVQRRAVALHHLDAPWRPSDVEQRDGRIMRQGNTNKEVAIFRYVTEGSFDAYMWQTLERKKKFIDQIMRGKLGDIREIEDVGDTALSYAEVKALATGNPLLMQKAKVDTALSKLTRLERQHDRTQTNLRRDTMAYAANAAEADANAVKMDEAIKRRTDTSGKKFAVTVRGDKVADRGQAAEQLKIAMADQIYNAYGWDRDKAKYLASFGGHDLYGAIDTHYDKLGRRSYGMTLTWDGLPGMVERLTADRIETLSPGIFTTLRNSLDGFESRRDLMRNRAEHLRGEIEQMQSRIGLPFAKAEELAAARAESARIAEAMTTAGVSDTGPGDTGPDAGVTEARKRTSSRLAGMGRGQAGPAKDVLKRFSNPAAAGKVYASADGAIAMMGTGNEQKVFLTADAGDIWPREALGTGQTLSLGTIADPQALLDELAALDLPWSEGISALHNRWSSYGHYEPIDYSISYEERARRQVAKREEIRERAESERAAIKAVWKRHLVPLEEKSLDAVISVAELAALAEIKAATVDEDSQLESYADLVDQDVRYMTDAGGTLHQLTPCTECGGDISMPVYGDVSAASCMSCGARPKLKRAAPVG